MAFRRFVSLRNLQNLRSSTVQTSNFLHSSKTFAQQTQYKTPLSATETDNIAESLRKILGTDNVAVSEAVKTQHGQDEGPEKGIPPDIVAFAESTEHVSEVDITNIPITYCYLKYK